jgi:predicted ATPase
MSSRCCTFDLDAVAAVIGHGRSAAIDEIDSLIAKSLVIHTEVDGRSRFRLFETTTAYAQQRLADAGEAIEVRDRHLDHYSELAGRYFPAMFSDLEARSELGLDRANIVAAFEWAGAQDQWSTAARLLLGAFTVFYSNPVEGRALVDRCVERLPDDEHDLAMRLVCNQSWLHVMVGDYRGLATAIGQLRNSSTPLHQVHGYSLTGLFVGLSQPSGVSRIWSVG